MNISYQSLYLQKRHPLRISRGVHAGSTNLFVTLKLGEHEGLGEVAPGIRTGTVTAKDYQAQLESFLQNYALEKASPTDAWRMAKEAGIASCAWAGVDIAWWDLLAKQGRMPLFRLLGLSQQSVATSLTIGIESPEVVHERVREILTRSCVKYLKVKLGTPDGIEADKAMFESVIKACKGFDVGLRVDANGGWSLRDAIDMIKWLAERNVEYVEQPLSDYNNDALPELFKNRALPIYIDESCNLSTDVAAHAAYIDGVNVKLMKCGGITEAVRIVATARAHGLKTMIGCMGESSVSISAAAAIGSLFDYIDLDSHLNLSPDPAVGAKLIDGVIVPTRSAGHGAVLC